MSKQNDDIFSPSLSPFFINLVEDNIDDNKLERILLKFNEMLACVDSDTDVSITSNIDFEDFEDFENFEKEARKQEIYNEIDEIIDHLEQTKFTPCVIVDFINGKFQRYGKTGKLRQIRNLLGTW